jgi:AraC-like DNA-binding protein
VFATATSAKRLGGWRARQQRPAGGLGDQRVGTAVAERTLTSDEAASVTSTAPDARLGRTSARLRRGSWTARHPLPRLSRRTDRLAQVGEPGTTREGQRTLQATFCLMRLASGDADGARVAHDLGYFDQAHFIRDFKSMVGRSPGAFAAKRASPGS